MTTRWRTILAIDHDAKACEVYRANVGIEPSRVLCREVRDVLAAGVIVPGMADVILGGPPCQPFSQAGKRAGSADARDCVPDFIEGVDRGRPRMFLMEEVPGFGTFEDGRYMQRVVAALSRAGGVGYAVDARLLDAVSFGVPQFRMRWWFWGIRNDIAGEIRRGPMRVLHNWPRPTHVWPWPSQSCMFCGDLLPAVVVGEALEMDGWIDRLGRLRNCSRNGGAGGGGVLRMIQSHADAPRPVSEPASTLRSGGSGHDGCCVRVIGGGSNPRFPGDVRTERDITNEPSTTIPAAHTHNAVPAVHEYRWSDAMREKHPPASPASPAPTVAAKWYKGGAEGLLSVDGRTWESRHPPSEPSEPSEPSVTLRGRSPRDSGRCVEGVVRDGLQVRRLTPSECARLQSLPDDFVWPASVAKTHRYRVIGNGWASLMSKRMSESLGAADPKSVTVIDMFCGGDCGAVGWHGRAWEYTRGREAVDA